MKKRLISCLLLLLLVLGLTGCHFSCTEDDTSPLSTSVTVTLRYGNGEADGAVHLPVGGRLPTPANPEKAGWVFRGWYTDDALTKPYDFSLAVHRNLTLFAGYLPDYEQWTNRLTDAVMPSLVLVRTVTATDAGRGTKTGSGIVFFTERDGSDIIYYLLTNNHVVTDAVGGLFATPYTVEDYRGEGDYRSVTLLASSAEYDLAVLRMRGSADAKHTLPAIPFASACAASGEAVAAIGQPGGQRNALTYGHAEECRALGASAGSDDSQVMFPVLYHTAPIASGSSGGAVVNCAGELVAVNFAGAYSEEGEYRAGLAIPIERVLEYLRTIPEVAALL